MMVEVWGEGSTWEELEAALQAYSGEAMVRGARDWRAGGGDDGLWIGEDEGPGGWELGDCPVCVAKALETR